MIKKNILEIRNLYAGVDNKNIIDNFNLSVNAGEVHVIMGQNGSGKSTLAKIIAGHPAYKIKEGLIRLNGKDITLSDPEERAHAGIFLAFQYPIEIPGVNNLDFLRLAYNEKRKSQEKKEIDPLSFFDLVNKTMSNISIDREFLNRNVNEGFSGGEKKKNEILQMSLLNNDLSILDETDSGLDIDALKKIANSINIFRDPQKAIILITHYQRLLNYILPDFVHVMEKGRIVRTGGSELAEQLEQCGYGEILKPRKI